MSGERVDLRLDRRAGGAVAFLTIDNRAKLNTLDRALMTDFIGKVETLASLDDLRALVLRGGGDKAFIGGASIPEMATLTRDTAREFITLVHRTCDCLRRLPVPVIAAIDGYAPGWRSPCPAIFGSLRRGRNLACRKRRWAYRR